MIKIESKEKLPFVLGVHFEGHLTDKEPYKFIAAGFDQNLTRGEWEKLKAFAKREKPEEEVQTQPDETGGADTGGEGAGGTSGADAGGAGPGAGEGTEPTELEKLKKQYAALSPKTSPDAVALRKRIKELEEQAKG